MKYFIILSALALTACGGGGSSTASPEPQPEPLVEINLPEYLYIEVNPVFIDQRYIGRGIAQNGSIATYPTALANSDYVAVMGFDYEINTTTGDIVADIKVFRFIDSQLTVEIDLVNIAYQGSNEWYGTFNYNGGEYDVNIQPQDNGFIDPVSVSDIDRQWSVRSNSFDGDRIVTELVYAGDNTLTGFTNTGCGINGTIEDAGNHFSLELTLSGCAEQGDYSGKLQYLPNSTNGQPDRIIGSVSNNNNGLFLDFNLQ